ncbi:hypothetical protein [Microvirga sp. P5_D2]
MSNDNREEDQALPAHLRELSYKIHTNRELEFMLQGLKPLAYFHDMIFDDQDMWEPEEEFERQVELGTFVKHEVRELCEPYSLNGHIIRGEWTRYYALKDEARRIPAFMMLKNLIKKHPWSDALERMEGALLGYTDEQNDEWLVRRRQRHVSWQCATLYAITTSEILADIKELGKRAFPKGSLPHLQLFTAERIPSRDALEQAGLLKDAYCKLIRFGVHWHFFKDFLEHTPAAAIARVSVRSGTESKDLNKALCTDIQIFKLT